MPLDALYIYLFVISLQSKVQRTLCWASLDCLIYILYGFKLWYIYAVDRLALCFGPELCSSVCPNCLHTNLCLRILSQDHFLWEKITEVNHRIAEPWSHLRKSSLSKPLLKAGSPGSHSVGFWVSSGWSLHRLPRQPMPVFHHLHSRKVGFFIFKCNVLYFSLCLFPPVLFTGLYWKALPPSSLCPPFGYTLLSFPWAFSSPGRTVLNCPQKDGHFVHQVLVHQDPRVLSLPSCFPIRELPVSTGAWSYSPSDAEVWLSLSWTSWDSHSPVSQAFQGPSEWQHIHLVQQPLLPILYLQACWEWTLCLQPGH